jgi:hypothetical protein
MVERIDKQPGLAGLSSEKNNDMPRDTSDKKKAPASNFKV